MTMLTASGRIFEPKRLAAGVLAGLLHHAHEAYCGDVATPIKKVLGPAWRQFEDGVEKAVHASLGISALMAEWKTNVHLADTSALATEIRGLFLSPADADARIRALGLEHIEPDYVGPPAASTSIELAQRFLERYHRLRQEL